MRQFLIWLTIIPAILFAGYLIVRTIIRLVIDKEKSKELFQATKQGTKQTLKWFSWWRKESDLGPKKGNWSSATKAFIVFVVSGIVWWIFGEDSLGKIPMGIFVISFWWMVIAQYLGV